MKNPVAKVEYKIKGEEFTRLSEHRTLTAAHQKADRLQRDARVEWARVTEAI